MFQNMFSWIGAALCLAFGLSLATDLLQKRWSARRRPKLRVEIGGLDWEAIDRPAQTKDCEIPGSSGACTGLECYVYQTCNYPKKKPLPK